MPFGKLLPPGYERTCKDCGYSWQLSRGEARLRVNKRTRYTGRARAPAGVNRMIATKASYVAEFGRCAKCGGHSFTQQPLLDYKPLD
jgi:hypothetical protein